MVKKIEGSYVSIEETIQTVRRLLNESYYLSGDITIITNRKNRENLEDLTSVQVDKVATVEDKSTWDRFKSMFSASNDEATLEQYGIEMHDAVKFEEDLKNGNYIIIVEDDKIPNEGLNEPVTSIDDAIVEARDENTSDNQALEVKETKIVQPTREPVSENEEDPLLDGSVDRGPIYGVVNDETNEEPLDVIVEDDDNNKV
ncbi:general stress protein [Desemzia sp. RIT804]|uniref:general stress protein n=1 Tax=Desemzia sp. RIT 804 TaxID=2810209 RepID=UPI00195149B1|nr:general stress protein [Desemzia sp. RIT 804]MBM6615906.1 general stress protein [Desemzia sp. RIT 804]